MTVSTAGYEVSKGSQRLRAAVELVSSMRFAIALLTIICIASVIGTVLKQHEPLNNYINQFGPFWYEVFKALSLYTVYSAWWFMLILAFLVLSTSLCVMRNTPKIVADLKLFKENIREQSLKAFAQKATVDISGDVESRAHAMGQTLLGLGWKVKLQRRETEAGVGWMVAAKSGAANKLGYLAAHSAIVLVCVGGLLDGDLMVRAQTWFGGKEPHLSGGLIKDVPEKSRLSDTNPTFRGNLLVTEGTQSGSAILSQPQGVLIQDLPFNIELKKFIVEYYDTGMPRLFASDIVIHDKYTGESSEHRVEVNHPVMHRGINIFQSSFDDGGSKLMLKAAPINGVVKPFEMTARVGETVPLSNGDKKLLLEVTGLRVINVENFANNNAATDVRAVDLKSALVGQLGHGNKTVTEKKLRNVGPSFSYKLRDEAGQAVEYQNYMLPMELDGNRVFLLGMRDTPGEPFRYLRVPADDNDSLDGFVRLKAALADQKARYQAVDRYVAQSAAAQKPAVVDALTVSARRAIDLFAGADDSVPRPADMPGTGPMSGLQAVSAFMEVNVPQAEREKAGDVLLRILNGTLFELMQVSREQAGLPPLPRDDATGNYMSLAVIALSDAFFYPSPMAFELTDYEQVQASVFQVARAPGQSVVYLGCFFLIVGVFMMLYVRERRLWVWLTPAGSGVQATLALSTNRKMLDNDRDFDQLKSRLTEVNA